MSKTTNIAWCDSTANPVIGCTKVSAGCANCYAANDTPARVLRHQGLETWGPKAERVAVKGFEKSMLAMNRKPWICDECGAESENEWCSKHEPADAKCHRRRVFVGSQCDLFDPAWKIETLAHTFDVIRRCPDIETIICTKRPELWLERIMKAREASLTGARPWIQSWLNGNPPSHITLLTSVENQEAADKRIPELLKIPAARRGLSMEPLLGPVNLMTGFDGPQMYPLGMGIQWLIVGGESGTGARPCNVDWIRDIVRQGKAAGVATFVKQLGAKPYQPPEHDGATGYYLGLRDKKGGDTSEWPKDLRVQEWPA